jgi:universal stress protein A
MPLPRKILVATDFSESAGRALDYAVDLAAKLEAELGLVHVLGITDLAVAELGAAITSAMLPSVTEDARKKLGELVAACPAAKIEAVLRDGDIRWEILGAARRFDAGLIILGTHGRRGISRTLLGSVAESVVRHAQCPVLVVRETRVG